MPAAPEGTEEAAAPGGTSDPDRAVGAGDGSDPTLPLRATTVRSPRPESDDHGTDADGIHHTDGDGPEHTDPTDPHDPQEVTR